MNKIQIETESWAILLKTYNKCLGEIVADFKEEDLPAMEWYDVLWCLERQSDHRLRLIELGEKVDMEKYSVTRIVDKLVSEKLVTKTSSPEDGRGMYATLTEKGKKLRAKMWLVYKDSIVKHFGSKLSEEDHITLMKILTKIRPN